MRFRCNGLDSCLSQAVEVWEPRFQSLDGGAPLWRSGPANGILVSEQSNFLEGVLQINGLGPFYRHEVLAFLEVIEVPKISTFGRDLKNRNVPIRGPHLKVFGRLYSPCHQSHSHESGTRYLHPDPVAWIEKLKSPAVPRSATARDEAETDGVFPGPIEGAIELPVPRFSLRSFGA